MAYLLEQAPHEQAIAKQAIQARQPLPDSIANAPELQAGLQLYLQAFFDLDSERSELAPIPWSSIADYAAAYDFDEEQTADLIDIIRKVDSAHINRLAEKQAAKYAKKSSEPGKRARGKGR